MTEAADELEALRQSKARYCRFLDTKDVESWRDVFAADVVVTLGMAVSTGGAENFVPMMGGLENGASKQLFIQESDTRELTLTSATATGIWALEDLLIFGLNSGGVHGLYGAGHYHETYQNRDGSWLIKSLHLTRTILKITGGKDG